MALFASLYVPHVSATAEFRQRLREVVAEFSPRVHSHGDRLVVLDASGLVRLFGDGRAIGIELGRVAVRRGWAPRVVVAATRVAAILMAKGRPGLTVIPPGAEAAWLAPMPIGVLDAFLTPDAAERPSKRPRRRRRRGATHRHYRMAPPPELPLHVAASRTVVETLERWGLRTLGDLAALPPADLAARVGQVGPALQRLARGEDRQPFVPEPSEERFAQSLELEWPVDGLEPLSFVLARLLDPLCAALERADYGAAVLRLYLQLVTRATFARELQLPAPMRDPRVLRTLLLLDLESHPPPAAIDRVTVEADPAPGRIVQFSLIEHPLPQPEALSTLLARLIALMGEGRCGAPALVDTHRPGAFALTRFTPPGGADTSVGPRSRARLGSGHDGGVTAHQAPSTKYPPSTRHQAPSTDSEVPPLPGVLRRFRTPIRARVVIERGRPVRVTPGRRGLVGGRVEQAAGPWRTSGEWWNTSGGGWARDEWDVLLSDGAVYRIYQDREEGGWFIDGIVD